MFRGSLTPRGPALRLRAACKSRSRHVRVLVADDQHASLASNSTHQIINRGLAVLKDPKRKRLVYLFNRSQHAADEKLRQVIKAVEAKTVIFVRPQSGVRAEDDGLLDMCVHELSTCAVMLDVAEGGEQLLLQSHDSPDVLFSRMKKSRCLSYSQWIRSEKKKRKGTALDQQPTQPTRFKSLNAFLNDIPEELQLSESLSATLNLDFWAKGGSGSDGSESGGGSRAGKGFGKDASSAGKGFGKEASGEGANFSAEASQESADDEADDFSQDASPGFEADSSLSWQLGSDPFDWTVSMSLGDLASETHGRGEGASEEEEWVHNVTWLEELWQENPGGVHIDGGLMEAGPSAVSSDHNAGGDDDDGDDDDDDDDDDDNDGDNDVGATEASSSDADDVDVDMGDMGAIALDAEGREIDAEGADIRHSSQGGRPDGIRPAWGKGPISASAMFPDDPPSLRLATSIADSNSDSDDPPSLHLAASNADSNSDSDDPPSLRLAPSNADSNSDADIPPMRTSMHGGPDALDDSLKVMSTASCSSEEVKENESGTAESGPVGHHAPIPTTPHHSMPESESGTSESGTGGNHTPIPTASNHTMPTSENGTPDPELHQASCSRDEAEEFESRTSGRDEALQGGTSGRDEAFEGGTEEFESETSASPQLHHVNSALRICNETGAWSSTCDSQASRDASNAAHIGGGDDVKDDDDDGDEGGLGCVDERSDVSESLHVAKSMGSDEAVGASKTSSQASSDASNAAHIFVSKPSHYPGVMISTYSSQETIDASNAAHRYASQSSHYTASTRGGDKSSSMAQEEESIGGDEDGGDEGGMSGCVDESDVGESSRVAKSRGTDEAVEVSKPSHYTAPTKGGDKSSSMAQEEELATILFGRTATRQEVDELCDALKIAIDKGKDKEGIKGREGHGLGGSKTIKDLIIPLLHAAEKGKFSKPPAPSRRQLMQERMSVPTAVLDMAGEAQQDEGWGVKSADLVGEPNQDEGWSVESVDDLTAEVAGEGWQEMAAEAAGEGWQDMAVEAHQAEGWSMKYADMAGEPNQDEGWGVKSVDSSVQELACFCMSQLRLRSTQAMDTGRDLVVVLDREEVVHEVVRQRSDMKEKLMLPPDHDV